MAECTKVSSRLQKLVRRSGKSERSLFQATAVFLLGAVSVQAQTNLTAEEQARLAAADSGQAPTATAIELPFEEPFDGKDLAGHWQLLNADKDSFVVENGILLALTSGGKNSLRNADTSNIFELQGVPPEGDFDLAIKGKLDPKTGYDEVWLGLRESPDNFIAAHLYVLTKGCGPALFLRTVANQPVMPEGEPVLTAANHSLFDGPIIKSVCDKAGRPLGDQILSNLFAEGFELTLSRRGLRYRTSLTLTVPDRGAQKPAGLETVHTNWIARMAPFGKPVFLLGQGSRASSGETLAEFDHFSIRRPQQ
jgi:hypothetical protein